VPGEEPAILFILIGWRLTWVVPQFSAYSTCSCATGDRKCFEGQSWADTDRQGKTLDHGLDSWFLRVLGTGFHPNWQSPVLGLWGTDQLEGEACWGGVLLGTCHRYLWSAVWCHPLGSLEMSVILPLRMGSSNTKTLPKQNPPLKHLTSSHHLQTPIDIK
jgi:hypothetical protein